MPFVNICSYVSLANNLHISMTYILLRIENDFLRNLALYSYPALLLLIAYVIGRYRRNRNKKDQKQ